MPFDPEAVRRLFPALRRSHGGEAVVWADGPGGTQVPQPVIDAMTSYLSAGGSNLGGPFTASEDSAAVVAGARAAVADLFNAAPGEVVFGQNMTSLTFAMSRALARTWSEGDEIVVTRLDHDANVTPWVLAAEERGVVVHRVDFDRHTTALDHDGLEALLGPRTRMVAIPAASNALGTIVDVPRVAAAARAVGALTYVDAVHYTPHGSVDVSRWGCDFVAASAYKFFGPHTGVLWGRRELLEAVAAYKLRPAPAAAPGKWETGTQSFESLAGVTAAVEYLATLGEGETRRRRLVDGQRRVGRHEAAISDRFLAGVAELAGVQVHGVTGGAGARTPTFALTFAGLEPAEAARRLGAEGIYTWSGHYYAVSVMEHLGLDQAGGALRVGFVHYNTTAEVDRVLEALERHRRA